MTDEMFKRYMADNSGQVDREIRNKFNIPDNRYYSVTTWPEHLQGRVFVDSKRVRDIPVKKISKSDQQ